MKNKIINKKIVDLWNKYFKDDKDVYHPIFYDNFKKGGILFVGFNPSFSVNGFKSVLSGTEYHNLDVKTFFKWNNISYNLDLVDDCIKMENYAFEKYSYFNKVKEIANEAGQDWQHIDLFLYKETNQNNFKKLVFEGDKLSDFAKDQINIFTEAIKLINPVCMVVINASASEIIRNELSEYIKWDNKEGFHWFTKLDKKIPIFFSSMLSGQRALDRWSYERLKWHICKSLS